MRYLTITRRKSFVGCLMKMKVYIEDPHSAELTINGFPCRKLGTLKNGETATFPIGEQAAKVFVIADKVSKGYCCDCYPIPAGTENLAISGKNKFHPGAGNPFRFDGVTDPEILANRKKGNGKGTVILIASIILGALLGILLGSMSGCAPTGKPKDFSAKGMTITLTDEFKAASYEGFTQGYESNSAVMFALKEDFAGFAGFEDYSLEDYAQLVAQANHVDPSTVKTGQGFLYYSFVNQGSDGTEFYYVATLHKGTDAFWLIQFATPAADQDKMHDQFLTWAGSVRFD